MGCEPSLPGFRCLESTDVENQTAVNAPSSKNKPIHWNSMPLPAVKKPSVPWCFRSVCGFGNGREHRRHTVRFPITDARLMDGIVASIPVIAGWSNSTLLLQ
jgi:hypothetical protein